jgi:hypothetical protein
VINVYYHYTRLNKQLYLLSHSEISDFHFHLFCEGIPLPEVEGLVKGEEYITPELLDNATLLESIYKMCDVIELNLRRNTFSIMFEVEDNTNYIQVFN